MRLFILVLLFPFFAFSKISTFTVQLHDGVEISVEYFVDLNGKLSELKFSTRQEAVVSRVFTLDDKKVIKKLLSEKKLDAEKRRLLEFFADFLPVGFPLLQLSNLSTSITAKLNEPYLIGGWISICERIGEKHNGSYTAFEDTLHGQEIVGLKTNKCFGRCGAGCGKILHSQRHTQECFNHDLCTRQRGEVFGECSDEFLDAAPGFFNAPQCGEELALN